MNEEIIFKWDREKNRESVGKCIWKSKKVKVKWIVLSPNSTKIWRICFRCLRVEVRQQCDTPWCVVSGFYDIVTPDGGWVMESWQAKFLFIFYFMRWQAEFIVNKFSHDSLDAYLNTNTLL